MEYVSGGNLSQISLESNFSKLEQWLIEISSAMVYLHDRGIIHRDIKLSNIVLTHDNKAKLIDFGISIWKWMLPYETNNCIGSPCYMAPEMVLKQ